MDIENLIFEEKLRKLVKKDIFGEYILKSDLEDLKLNVNERRFVSNILRKKGIELRLEVIKKEDRTTSAKEYDYGDVAANGLESKDIPRMAVIQHNDNNEVISEDYSKLEQYIENTIIKSCVKYKKVIIDEEEDFELSVALGDLLKYGFSEKELKYIINSLGARGIIVRGYNSTLDGEFDNYKYLATYKNDELPKPLEFKEQNLKFSMMHDDNISSEERHKIRHELIESNARLVPYVAYKYSIVTGIDINELNSYGNEGLIHAVDHFDETQGAKFATYAVPCIRGYILRGIESMLGFEHQKYLFSTYLEIKKKIEEKTDQTICECPEIIYEIASYVTLIRRLGKDGYSYFRNHLFVENPVSLDDNNQEEIRNIMITENLEDVVFSKCLSDDLENVLSTLTDREQLILRMRFGLVDGRTHTLEEVGMIFGETRERIRQRENKALRKIRVNSNLAKKLRDYC